MTGHVTLQGKVWYAIVETRDDKNKRKQKWIKLPDCKGKKEAKTACGKLEQIPVDIGHRVYPAWRK
jgi:hypothetical protein